METLCPNCQQSIAGDARFCSHCGTSLARTCPSCGTELAPDARFCSACGHRLDEAEEVVDGGSEERKVVTVLFCDLAGFTAHTEQADPEDVRARLTTYHARVRQDVERFGGRIEKLMGDGVFAVFGAPVAHEDDPERAVRSALRIQESVEELNAREPDLALVVRAAVTTGEAIVQLDDRPDREGIIGDVVNTASRLEAVAAPGTVVVDERTYLATRSVIEHDALAPVEVKGKVGALPIWRAVRARSNYGVAVEEDVTTPFVGRAEELSLLVDAFERTLSKGSPHLVTITGEPGVGKSRLVREFRAAIDDRTDLAYWRQGRCLPYGEGVTFWAIGEIVKAQAGILESEPPAESLRKLGEAVGALVDDADDAAWISLRLGPLAGSAGTEGAERSELFAAWLAFFAAMAARNPLVMVIEDLHWADDAVVEFLEHLVEWATDAPILLVVTARPELFEDRPAWGAGRRDAATVTLAPLSSEESAQLMAAISDRPVMSAEMQRALLERSGGNPLYVTEYVRLADEEGWFDRAARGEDLPLPDSIQAIISARVDLLDAVDKTLLQIAAVVGRVFWTGAVTFADAGNQQAVREGLRRLVRRELIRPVRRSSMQGQEEYTFSHILIRDVAYGMLTRDERARVHNSTARWLEAVSGDRAAEVAELLAHHLTTAVELSPTEDVETRARVHRFVLLAAKRAASFDLARGAEYARQAVQFATTDAEQGAALLELGRTKTDDSDEIEEILQEAIACFATAGDRLGEVEATSELSGFVWYRGDADRVDALDERILEMISGLPPGAVVARAVIGTASKLFLRGQLEEAIERAEQGLALAREIGDTEIVANGLVVKGSTLVQMGLAEGMADVEEALRIELDRNQSRDAMRTYNNLATFHIEAGDPRAGLELIDGAIEYGSQRGLTPWVDWSYMTRNEALFPLGEWDELRATVDRYRGESRIAGTQNENGMRAWHLLLSLFQGESHAAWSEVAGVVEVVRDVKDPQGLVPVLATAAAVAMESGHLEDARAYATEFAETGREHPLFLAAWLFLAAPVMLATGMIDELDGLSRIADRSYEWLDVKVDAVRGLIAAKRGRGEEGLALIQPAIAMADRQGMITYATILRIDAARAAQVADDEAVASELLERAEEAASRLGAELLIGRIEELRGAESTATG